MALMGARALVHVDTRYSCGSGVNTRWEKRSIDSIKTGRSKVREEVRYTGVEARSPVPRRPRGSRAEALARARSPTCTEASAAKQQQVNGRHFISCLIRSFIMWRRGHTCLRLQGLAVHVAACTCMGAALFHFAGF